MVKKKKKKKEIRFERVTHKEVLGKSNPKRLKQIKIEQEEIDLKARKGGLFFKK